MHEYDHNLRHHLRNPARTRAPDHSDVDADYEPQAAHVPLAHYLWILRRHGWKIAGFVVSRRAGDADRLAAADADL